MCVCVCLCVCHRHRIQIKEKMERFRCIYINQGCWQMCRWTMVFPVHMCSGFPAGRSKQMIMTSWNDVIMISHSILGGNYKRRAHPILRPAIWVFWHCLSTSHRPSTLAISVLLVEQSITRMKLKPSGLFYFLPGPLHPNWMTESGVSVHSHEFHVHGCQIKWPSGWNIWSQSPDEGPSGHAIPECKVPMGVGSIR